MREDARDARESTGALEKRYRGEANPFLQKDAIEGLSRQNGRPPEEAAVVAASSGGQKVTDDSLEQVAVPVLHTL